MAAFSEEETQSFININPVSLRMRGAFVAVMLVLGLFVFGCAGQTSAQANVSANGSASTGGSQAPSGGAPSGNATTGGTTGTVGTNVTVNTSGGGTGTTTTGTASGGTSGGGSSGAVDTSGKDFTGLLAMGVPLTCTVTSENGTIQMFMNGQGVTRLEVPATSADSTCNMTVVLMQGNKFDMTCTQGSMMGGNQGPFAGCDWIEMTINATATATGGSSSSGSSEASSIQKAPAAQFSCQPWLPDSSKFTTSGKVCNLDQIMNQYGAGGGYGGYGQ